LEKETSDSKSAVTKELLEENILGKMDIYMQKMLLWKKFKKKRQIRSLCEMKRIAMKSLGRKEEKHKEKAEKLRLNLVRNLRRYRKLVDTGKTPKGKMKVIRFSCQNSKTQLKRIRQY
jgi:hypothetical protein